MSNPLKIVSINREKSKSDLSKILAEKWKKKQEQELELLRSGKKKLNLK